MNVDLGTFVIIVIIIVSILGVWLLPLRKRWNDDGADDERRETLEEDE